MSRKVRNTTRRIMACMLMSLVLISALPSNASAYDTVSDPIVTEKNFATEVKAKNGKVQGVIEYLNATYGYSYKKYKGSGQCYGFAEYARKMFGTSYKKKNFGVKLTKGNLYKKLKNVKPGSHVRFSAIKNGGGTAHSIVLMKINKKYIWYIEGNGDGINGIYVCKEDLSWLTHRLTRRGRKYLAWAMEPRGSVTTVKSIDIKASCVENSPETHIGWRPVKKAKSYEIYRSTSKKKGYKKNCNY